MPAPNSAQGRPDTCHAPAAPAQVSDWPGINVVEAAHDAFVSNVKPAEEDDGECRALLSRRVVHLMSWSQSPMSRWPKHLQPKPKPTCPSFCPAAHWLLDFYSSFRDTDVAEDDDQMLREALESLSSIKGSFAFVIYDSGT